MLRTAWARGDRTTAKASRAKYVYNVDNMIGVHPGIVRRKVIDLLHGEAHAAARELLERRHFHISTEDIVENVVERLRGELSGTVSEIEEKAVSARREGDQFVIETDRGRAIRGQSVVLSTGVMDRQPSIKMTTRSGKVVDDIRWLYPYANSESLLYCILCEGAGLPAPCPELAHELAAYAGADIDQATCARIEEHLARCSRCAGACAALQRSVSLCRQIPGGEVPAPIRSAVRKALREAIAA